MKQLTFIILLTALFLPACGDSESPSADQAADPLEQVPDADAAAAEADGINAENSDQAMADIEKELEADQ